mgnify:CR=1 FL=1|tara:strand:+ start:769 stop:1413 length:645 start_codon:yes stop_codon:yes gene_type:complete
MNQWEFRWHEGRVGFHLKEVNSYLIRHSEQLLKRDINKIFVPLCGKSLDLYWLAERIKKVVGVELVRKPVEDFFKENNINFSTKLLEEFELFQSDFIEIFNGDFFALNESMTGQFDAIYDRASIVAIDAPERLKYANHLMRFLTDDGMILLITLEYDQNQMLGPPFSVPFSEIIRLFSNQGNLEILETCDILDDRLRGKGLSKILERVIKITKL